MSDPSDTLILLYGESSNDTGALAHLIPGLLPAEVPVAIRKIRTPQILARRASPRKRIKMSDFVAALEKQERNAQRRVVVVAHRDCDSVEPSHTIDAEALREDLSRSGVAFPVAATPAWCIETWWMQFSGDIAKVRSCWARVDYSSRSVGLISRAKDDLIEALRPRRNGHKCPDYRESDGIRIAEEIRRSGAARSPAKLLSKSLEDFRSKLQAAVIPS